MGVYMNWVVSGSLLHHPADLSWMASELTSVPPPFSTKRAFFSEEVTSSYVELFQRHINAYESFLWPWG